MSTNLSRYFEKLRLERGLKPGELARLIGAPNASKIGGRIRQFELTGVVSRELLIQLMAFFGVDKESIDRLIAVDRQEYYEKWLQWVDTPIEPYCVTRLMATVYRSIAVPPELTQEQAEARIADFAKKEHLICCLVWSRRLSVWFNREGVVYARNEATPGVIHMPCSRIGHKSFLFAGDLRKMVSVELPPKPMGPIESL